MTTIIEKCKHGLTEDEMKERANSLTRKLAEIEALREQKKEICARFKNDIDRLALETKQLALAWMNGYEYQDTECAVEMDYSRNEVRVMRMDTGEILRTRTMTAAEKQADLALTQKDKDVGQPFDHLREQKATAKRSRAGKVHGT